MTIARIRAERTVVARRLAAVGRAAMIAGMLAGCSWVPDEVNPVEWYKGALGDDSDDSHPALATPRTPPQGQFPDVNSIPATADLPAAAAPLPQGLGADHSHANYAGTVHRDVAPTKPLVRRPPMPDSNQVATSPLSGSDIEAQNRLAGARSELGPQYPPSERPNLIPPARPNIPDQIGGQPRGRRTVDDQYQRRLSESSAASVDSTYLPQPSSFYADSAPVHLVPPGGRGKGLAAAQPSAPGTSSFQVASVGFSGGGAGLSAEDRRAIAAVAKVYRQTGGVIRIQAIADSDDIGNARANAVAAELVRLGIPARKLLVATDTSGVGGDGANVYLDY